MMNAMLYPKLSVVAAASVNSNLFSKLFVVQPFHFRNVFSTEAHSQNLFSQFASSKLNLSEADITRMLKRVPQLQKLRTLHKVEQFVNMLKQHGCNEVHIAKIMRSQPGFIGFADRILEPKIKLLEDFGFVDRNLTKLLTSSSSILRISLKDSLLPRMEFLKNVFQSHDVLVKALLKAPRLLCYNLEKTLKPSLAYWEGWFSSGTELASFLKVFPAVLSRTSLTPTHVNLIHKIRADKESKLFKYIVGIVATNLTKTLEAKIENLKLCGLSAEETWQVLGAAPIVFNLSKENVSEKINFLVNNMELPANYVVKHASLLHLNLDKIMRPRCLVWQKMKSINDIDLPLVTVLRMPEARFVSKIMKGHPESKTLWTIYENAISNASNRTKSSAKS
ncbi:hypothetical protein SUGI_0651840 [Cryptomeria japonica]|nr:hypothetical protein SUGI_0651840 [Cryptomeria japonica]